VSLRSLIQGWIWAHPHRRALTLLRFAEVEADGGRDLVRAAELTNDLVLRRLFLAHANDEQRHAKLFRERGLQLLWENPAGRSDLPGTAWATPGERGLDDLRVERETEGALLAFLHLSESAAARDFAAYARALDRDPDTRAVFETVLHDETFHMNYTRIQLQRLAPQSHGQLLWKARASRLWKAYLRLAGAVAELFATAILTLQYYILVPPFALFAKRAARRAPEGWTPVPARLNGRLQGQY